MTEAVITELSGWSMEWRGEKGDPFREKKTSEENKKEKKMRRNRRREGEGEERENGEGEREW